MKHEKISRVVKFNPSPIKMVRVIDHNGKTVKVIPMNRKERRRLKIRG